MGVENLIARPQTAESAAGVRFPKSSANLTLNPKGLFFELLANPDPSVVAPLLSERNRLVEEAASCIRNALPQIERALTTEFQSRRPLENSTRQIIGGTLVTFPQEIKNIWRNAIMGPSDDENWLMKAFCWSLKSLTDLKGNTEIFIKHRSTNTPYAIHTHVDVPYFIKSFCGKIDPLTLAVAASHDSLEEGKISVRGTNGRQRLDVVNLQRLPIIFPTNGIGRMLQISIAALTESTFSEMRELCGADKLRKTALAKAKEAGIISSEEVPPIWIENFCVKHPLVFGGLGLQIQTTIDALFQRPELTTDLSLTKRKKLAFAIAATEIGDRLSDVSSLEYYYNPEEFGATSARKRVLSFAARISNMIDKIEGCIDNFDTNEQLKLRDGICLLGATLAHQITALPNLTTKTLEPFSGDEVRQHVAFMEGIQEAADYQMKQFISQKVIENIFCLEAKSA